MEPARPTVTTGGADESTGDALDTAIAAYEAAELDLALEILGREAIDTEQRQDEQRLARVVELIGEMAASLEPEFRRADFESLAESAARRLHRVRDATLPPRLARAWDEWESDDLDAAEELVRDELFACQRSGGRHAVRQVLDMAAELRASLDDDDDPRELDRIIANAHRWLDQPSMEIDGSKQEADRQDAGASPQDTQAEIAAEHQPSAHEPTDASPLEWASARPEAGPRARAILSDASGQPLELLAVVGLFALAGAIIVGWSLISAIDAARIIGQSELARAIGFILLFALVVSAEVGASLLGVAWLLYRRSRAGRALAFVVLALVFFAAAFGAKSSGWYVVAMLLTLTAGLLLSLAPAVRDAFSGADAPDAGQPTAIVVARMMTIAWIADSVILGSLYLLVGSFVAGKYAVYGILIGGGLAYAAYRVLRELPRADRRVRAVASALAGSGIVLGITGLDPAGFTAGATMLICLWATPGGRAWYGDAPLRLS